MASSIGSSSENSTPSVVFVRTTSPVEKRHVSPVSATSVPSVLTIHSDTPITLHGNDKSSETSPSNDNVDTTPLAPPSAESAYMAALFDMDANTGFMKITKNLHAEYIWAPRCVPTYLPCSPNGHATVISIASDGILHSDGHRLVVSLNDVSEKQFSGRLQSGVPYSLRMKPVGNTTVRMCDVDFTVTRIKGICSGIKSCICSEHKNSVEHHGYQEENTPLLPVPTHGPNNPLTQEMQKERDVFYFCQANFPIVCKHAGSTIASSHNTDTRVARQNRYPNWVLKSGFMAHHPTGDVPPVRMPDIVDCAEFGSPGISDRSGCEFLILPYHLQGANALMINNFVRLASEGLFPVQPRSVQNQCPPLPMTFGGKDCHQPIHGHEAVPISVISCSARYQYLIHYSDGNPVWAIIIGYGEHSHTLPFQRPSANQTKDGVERCMESNRTASVHEISDYLVSLFGSRPSMASIRKQKHNVRASHHPEGRDLTAIKRALRTRKSLLMDLYVHDIIDEREEDMIRLSRDQFGVVIVMWNESLLRRSLSSPTYGVDGSFSVVAKNLDDLEFELVSIVCPDPSTRRVFSPMRILASRKTTACRVVLFRSFFKELLTLGLPDPLTAPDHRRLTISTDFETTFAVALGRCLAEIYRPDCDLDESEEAANAYIEKVAFGCNVHAHRIVLEKINKHTNAVHYNWMINSHRYNTEEHVVRALAYMKTINAKTTWFAKWLEQNYIARVLWFWCRYKKVSPALQGRVMWTTNASESHHALMKGCREYVMTRFKGMDIVSFISFMESLDLKEHKNRSGCIGLPHTTTPVLNRSRKRALSGVHAQIELSGKVVSASQPKKAKRS